MEVEKVTCKHCNSTDVFRDGIFSKPHWNWDSQMFGCHSCNRKFHLRYPKGSLVREEPVLIIPTLQENSKYLLMGKVQSGSNKRKAIIP